MVVYPEAMVQGLQLFNDRIFPGLCNNWVMGSHDFMISYSLEQKKCSFCILLPFKNIYFYTCACVHISCVHMPHVCDSLQKPEENVWSLKAELQVVVELLHADSGN